jgi:hypothetical protein
MFQQLFCVGKVDMMVLCAAAAGKPYMLSPQVCNYLFDSFQTVQKIIKSCS